MWPSNHVFPNLSKIWLEGDHYKWRALRTNGVDERFITGNASDWEKFEKWAETVPYTMRNPLYHWTHLELKTACGGSSCSGFPPIYPTYTDSRATPERRRC